MTVSIKQAARYMELVDKRTRSTLSAFTEEELNEFKDLCMTVYLTTEIPMNQRQQAILIHKLIEQQQKID